LAKFSTKITPFNEQKMALLAAKSFGAYCFVIIELMMPLIIEANVMADMLILMYFS